MDDNRHIRIFYQIFFGMVLLVIVCFITPFTSSLGVIIVGLIAVLILSYSLPWLMDLFSTIYTSLIYGFDHSVTSYEGHLYQDNMEKAKRLVRDEKWYGAIYAYQEIINKAPRKLEPRFNLAKVYQKVGHLGLALNEYKKIIGLKDQFGATHPFVLESGRAAEELKNKPSEIEQECLNNPWGS